MIFSVFTFSLFFAFCNSLSFTPFTCVTVSEIDQKSEFIFCCFLLYVTPKTSFFLYNSRKWKLAYFWSSVFPVFCFSYLSAFYVVVGLKDI